MNLLRINNENFSINSIDIDIKVSATYIVITIFGADSNILEIQKKFKKQKIDITINNLDMYYGLFASAIDCDTTNNKIIIFGEDNK